MQRQLAVVRRAGISERAPCQATFPGRPGREIVVEPIKAPEPAPGPHEPAVEPPAPKPEPSEPDSEPVPA